MKVFHRLGLPRLARTWIALAGLAAAGVDSPALAQSAPSQEEARQALGAALDALDRSDYPAAERQFARMTEIEPRYAQGWLGLAEARLRLDRPQEALEAARKALEAAPDLGAAAFTVGRCLAELGSNREALAVLNRARELEPDNVDTLVLTALVLRELNRDADALALLDSAWKGGNRDPLLGEQLAFLRFDSGDLEGAAAVAQEGLVTDPGRVNLEIVLGFALAKDPTRRGEAAQWFEKALAAGVAKPGPVQLELGGILLDAGRAADALPHLEEAARLLPEAKAAHYRLSQARRATGDDAGARAALERFQELEARDSDAERGSKELGIALNEAQALANTDHLVEALAKLDQLRADHPSDARVGALRAKVLFSMGRRREAEQSIAEANARTPDRAEYQYLEGLFHMYAGRAAQAQASLERALALDGGLAEAYALLAGALVKQGEEDQAIAHFERAIELGVDAPEVRLGYAGALETLGRDREAEAQMEIYRKMAAGPPAAEGSEP